MVLWILWKYTETIIKYHILYLKYVFNNSAKRIIDRGLLFNPMKLNDLSH